MEVGEVEKEEVEEEEEEEEEEKELLVSLQPDKNSIEKAT